MAAAAVDNHNAALSCLDDPNFATICSFIEKFGDTCNLGDLPFDYLQEMLENTNEVPPKLAQIHVQLLRRVYKTVAVDKWEKQLAKFGHSYNAQDGWEIERFGYKKAKIQTKLRLLKTLLEAQFDYNAKFKNEVNKLSAEDLRRQPIGRDSEGQLYWYQVDPDANLRIYREDIDDETWEIAASNREEVLQLIEQLSNGVVKRNSNIEDENGDGELSPKEILLDTGKVPDDQLEDEDDDNDNNDEEDDEDAMQIDESYKLSTEEKAESEVGEHENLPEPLKLEEANRTVDSVQDSVVASPMSRKFPSESFVVSEEGIPRMLDNSIDRQEETKKAEEPTCSTAADTATASTSDVGRSNNHVDEPVSHSVENGTIVQNHASDQLVKPDSFNSDAQKDISKENAASVTKNFKEPLLLPPAPKLISQESEIWNPAVHESSKPSVDNHKFGAAESVTGSKYQPQKTYPEQRPTRTSQAKPSEFKREPIPLDNLKLFTQKMSAEPNTLSEELRKLTAEDTSDELEGSGLLSPKIEADKEEKFIKPDSFISIREKDVHRSSSKKRRETSPSNTSGSTKASHDRKSMKSQVPPTTKSEVKPVENKGLEEIQISQQQVTSFLSTETIHQSIKDELCTHLTHETESEGRIFSSSQASNSQGEELKPCVFSSDGTSKGELKAEVASSNIVYESNVSVAVSQVKPINENVTDTGECTESYGMIPTENVTLGVPSDPFDIVNPQIIESSECNPDLITSEQTSAAPRINSTTDRYEFEQEQFNIGAGGLTSARTATNDESNPSQAATADSQVPVVDTSIQTNSQTDSGIDMESNPLEIENSRQLYVPTDESNHDKGAEKILKDQVDVESPNKECAELCVGETSGSLKIAKPGEVLEQEETESRICQPPLDSKSQDTYEKKSDEIRKRKSPAEVLEPLVTQSRTWLVGYEDSSNDDDAPATEEAIKLQEASALQESKHVEIAGGGEEGSLKLDGFMDSVKRRNDTITDIEAVIPIPKKAKTDDPCDPNFTKLNPIVGEAIEEDMMIITGEGSGAELEGGNKRRSSKVVTEEQENADGETTKSSTKSGRRKKSEDAVAKTPTSRRKSFGNELNDLTPTERSVTELNGGSSTERPMRQSRRIAQIREKEEEERRKQEEEHLAQLKQAQMQKQQKQKEVDIGKKAMSKGHDKKSVKSKSKHASKSKQEYLPSPSISASESDNEEAYELPTGKKRGKRGRKSEEQKFKKGIKPWLHSSSEEDEEAVEEEEEAHEEEEEIHFDKSDHEFSCDSDLGEGGEVGPSRHARTAKIGPDAQDKYATTVCDKCTKGDHPEWILLCDDCDKGWHASCLRPQLWVVPEGEWFCPPCQHKKLVEKLGESLVEFDKILKKRESDELRKQRLTYVGISMENILPVDKSAKHAKDSKSHHRNSKSSRRRILSDEEDSENLNEFIDDKDDGESSLSRSNISEDDSDDEPMYKLRARRATKAFNFKEYDDMIDSALKEEGEEEEEPNELKEVTAEMLNEQNFVNKGNEEDMDVPKQGVDGVEKVESAPSEGSETLDEKERKYQELEKASQRKSRRRLNDLDATSDDDSDEDFKDSNGDDDDEEEEVAEDDSDWSGDRDADSDESIGRLRRQGKKERRKEYGRRETYLEVGSVRRSTRRVKPKYQYDESDQEDDDNDAVEPWEENSEASESNSESDDETWGKKKKVAPPPKSSRSVMRNFVLPQTGKSKSGVKRKKKRPAGSDDEDRPWNRGGTKSKKVADDSVQQRTTRGKKINFKDILESGESDDDGNIRPKRKRVVAPVSDDSDGPSSSKKLVAELNTANLRAAAEKDRQDNGTDVKEKDPTPIPTTALPNEPLIPANGSGVSSPLILPTPAIFKPMLEEELKPVPAPPYHPVRNQLREVLKRNSEQKPPVSQPQVSQPLSTSLLMSEILAAPPIRIPSPSKKNTPSPVGPLHSGIPPAPLPQPIHRGVSPQHTSASIPSEVARMMDPAFMQRAQAMRAFHPALPAWGRNPLPPPPYGNHAPGGPSPSPPASAGKPPPLSGLPFMTQSSVRSPYPTPPSLGIPTSNQPSLQSFHQFKREVGLPMYRLPPNLPGLPPRSANLLPQMHPGLGHPNPHLEQFYGPHGGAPFGIPGYGMPPHTQSQPMFSAPQHYDYRGDGSFKNEIMGLGGNATTSHGFGMKEDLNPGQGDGEFGGLVSYFSSQRGDDDMDT